MVEEANKAILDAIAALRTEMGTEGAATRAVIAGLRTELSAEIIALRTEVGADIAALRAAIAELRTEVNAEITATRAGIMDRIDRLQGIVEQLRNEMTVNWATADTAIRRVRGAEDEARGLYDLIAAVHREVKVLAARVDEMQSRGAGG